MLTCPRCGAFGTLVRQLPGHEPDAYWIGYLSETLSLILKEPTLNIVHDIARNALEAYEGQTAPEKCTWVCVDCGHETPAEGGAPCVS